MKFPAPLNILSLALLCLGLVACDKPGPAETAGRNLDQAADKAGMKIGETVSKVGDKLEEQSAKTGDAIDDAEITTKAKGAIFAEPGLKTLQISVDTIQGVVTLTGSADSLDNAARAQALAGAIRGVRSVDNRLIVKSQR